MTSGGSKAEVLNSLKPYIEHFHPHGFQRWICPGRLSQEAEIGQLTLSELIQHSQGLPGRDNGESENPGCKVKASSEVREEDRLKTTESTIKAADWNVELYYFRVTRCLEVNKFSAGPFS